MKQDGEEAMLAYLKFVYSFFVNAGVCWEDLNLFNNEVLRNGSFYYVLDQENFARCALA